MTDAGHGTNGMTQPALLRRAGLVCVLVGVCARLVTTTDPLPGWSLDPFTTVAPLNGMGPGLSMTLAGVSLIGLVLVLLGARREGEALPRGCGAVLVLVLAGLGLPAVLWHGWLGPTACVENANTLLVWVGAIAGAIAAMVACRHRGERALVMACCAGLAGPMALRAAIQVYSEHPTLVEEFRQNQSRFLATHGWAEGSANARAFARRLLQPEASAWLAMSNVYASVMVGCGLLFAGGLVAAVRARLWATGARPDLYCFLGVLAGTVLAVGGIVMAVPAGGALPKGAMGALVLGAGLFAAVLMRDRLPGGLARVVHAIGASRAMWLIGPGLIALALAAVVARGVVGERIGELSLLFRWFYMQAAAGIFGEHPVWGVGPDGFQGAYLLAKNPLSPEEVSSPHSMLWDYASMLGVFGLAWCGAVIVVAARAGRELVAGGTTESSTDSGMTAPERGLMICLAVVVGVSMAVMLWREVVPVAAAAPGAFGLLMVDGLTKLAGYGLVWLGLGAALLSMAGRTPKPMSGIDPVRAGLLAGGLAVLVHAQIELTGTDLSAAGWLWVVLGAGAAGVCGVRTARQEDPGDDKSRRSLIGLVGIAAAGLLAAGVFAASVPVWNWQRQLRASAARAAESTRLIQRFQAIGAEPGGGESPTDVVADLAEALGHAVPITPEGVGAGLDELQARSMAEAAETLERLARSPGTPSWAVASAAVRVRMTLTSVKGTEEVPGTVTLAAWAAERWPEDSGAFRRLAGALRQGQALGAEDIEEFADLAPMERAAELDPFSPEAAAQLATRLSEAGRIGEARRWAVRALEMHEMSRLDPLAGLPEKDVQMLRELSANP